MSGEPIAVVTDEDAVLVQVMRVLDGLAPDHPWVLVGGIAIFCRLGSITRPTQDADTVAKSQADLMDSLSGQGTTATILSPGRIEIGIDNHQVQVDVMGLTGEVASDPDFKTAFRAAKQFALETAQPTQVTVHQPDGASLIDTTIPLATAAALSALKTVSIVGRASGKTPNKVGSDIHDLVRIVEAFGAQTIAKDLVSHRELATWIEQKIQHHFNADMKHTLTRLRTFDRSPGAQALSDESVAGTGVLADALRDLLT